MKRLTTALEKRLKDGRTSKGCRLCRAEICTLFLEETEKQLKVKEYQTEKNLNIRRRTMKYSGSQRSLRRVGCFGFNGPLRQYFSLYRAVSQREGERGEKR